MSTPISQVCQTLLQRLAAHVNYELSSHELELYIAELLPFGFEKIRDACFSFLMEENTGVFPSVMRFQEVIKNLS